MKKNRRKILHTLLMCMSLIMVALLMSVSFGRLFKEKPQQNETIVSYHVMTDVSKMLSYKTVFSDEPGNSTGEDYIVIEGFNPDGDSTFRDNLTAAGSKGLELNIPEYFKVSVDGEEKEIPVREIDIALTVDGGEYFTQFAITDRAIAADSGVSSFMKSINSLVVPKTVRKISYGAFNGFNNLQKIEVPFVGTERGNRNTVESAFLAIFGSKNYKKGDVTATFPYMDDDCFLGLKRNDGTYITGMNSGYVPWYKASDTYVGGIYASNSDEKMVYPPKLKEVNITDEYLVDDHAFFYVPYLETLAIQFSSGLKDVKPTPVNAATIGMSAFSNCYWLHTVALPSQKDDATGKISSTISAFSEGTFRECEELTTLTTYSEFMEDGYTPNGKVILPNTTPISPSSTNTSEIYEAMFFNCKAMSHVTLSTDIRKIGKSAFEACGKLAYIDFPNASYEIREGECVIPDYISEIESYAFRDCKEITSIVVSPQVQKIGEGAFNGMNALTSVTLPFVGQERGSTGEAGLFGHVFGTTAGAQYVLQNTTGNPEERTNAYAIPASLKYVVITNETLVISGAFMNCSNIESLEIIDPAGKDGDSELFIQAAALAGCSGLKYLTIPFVGPMDIDEYNINASYWLSITVPTGTSRAQYQLGWIFGEYNYTEAGMVGINQRRILENYTGSYYFPKDLKSVTLTHQTVLLKETFYGLRTLEEVIVSEATKVSEHWVFGENDNLKRVSLPFIGITRGLKTVKYEQSYYYHDYYEKHANSMAYFFRFNSSYNAKGSYQSADGCEFDQVRIFGDWGNTNWRASVPKKLETIEITDETYFYSYYAFKQMRYVKNIKILTPETKVKSIKFNEGGFTGCFRLETLETPIIGYDYNPDAKDTAAYTLGYMFGDGTGYAVKANNRTYSMPNSLRTVVVGKYINYIAAYAFNGGVNLESISSEATITSIGEYCFANCKNLQFVNIPNARYTHIAGHAFENDVRLYKLDLFTPSGTVTTIGDYALAGTSIGNDDIHLDRYTSIGEGAFSKCLQITAIDFSVVTRLSIGTHLFEKCKNLVDVTLKPGYVNDFMFKDCESLKGLNFDGITEVIPKGMFEGCKSLQFGGSNGLIMSPTTSGVKKIGDRAFFGCESLETFELPTGLTHIGLQAFQGCSRIDKMVIPRTVTDIPMGTRGKTDLYDSGAFYGCNDEFYFEVFVEESKWPAGWKYNWNCYYPVKLIGDTSEQMFTYAHFSTNDYKGYLITGLNVYDPVYNEHGFKFIYAEMLTLDGTLTFPDTHNGVKVYGLATGCFDNPEYRDTVHGVVKHYLEEVDSFVLGNNFIYMGEDSLRFDLDGRAIYREIYVPKSSLDAGALAPFNCGELSYDNKKEGDEKTYSQSNKIGGLYYGNEVQYAANSIVYYNESWGYSGSSIVWKLPALNFTLNADHYTYNLGKAITPTIVKVEPNQNYIKYTTSNYTDFEKVDRFLGIFYPNMKLDDSYIGSTGIDKYELDLSSIRISYKRNINVGTGSIELKPLDSRLINPVVLEFVIEKYQIDIGYEAGEDVARYGVDSSTTNNPLSAEAHLTNIIMYNEMINFAHNDITYSEFRSDMRIPRYTYNEEKQVVFNSFTNGMNAYFPSNYVVTGVLSTSSAKSGFYYMVDNEINDVQYFPSEYIGVGEIVEYESGGFSWTVKPAVYDPDGNDVTKNFKFVITYAVYIEPYTIETINLTPSTIYNNLQWPTEYDPTTGYSKQYNISAGYYEYPYTGEAIIPVPIVKDYYSKQVFDAKIKVEVTVGGLAAEAIYPPSTGAGTVYEATITSYDTRNFKFDGVSRSIKFIVVKGKVHIKLDFKNYVIGEEEYQAVYDFDNIPAQSHTLMVTGLGNHTLSGKLVSVNKATGHYNWEKGTYTYIKTADAPAYSVDSDKELYWDTYGFEILDKNGNLCNNYFDVTYDLSLEIVYNIFDYFLTITDQGSKHVISGVDETIGITKYYRDNAGNIEMTFGADGYEHIIDTDYINVINKTGVDTYSWNDGTVDRSESDFRFTNLQETGYSVTLSLAKDRFEPITISIKVIVVKSDYVIKDISREWNREPVQGIDALARKPIEFSDPTKKDAYLDSLTFKFYKTTNTSLEIEPPVEIGSYIVVVSTTPNHNEWFNDLLETTINDYNSEPFQITRRNVYIDVVDDVAPYDSKPHDGEPWSRRFTSQYVPNIGLLDGDELTGYFVSNSSAVGVYDASVDGTFRAFNAWSVVNPGLTEPDQTVNYQIVFRGVYNILKKQMSVTSSGVTATFDSANPKYYSIDINVTDPNYNYQIWYSETEIPREADDSKENGWKLQKPYYLDPGVYTVYFKVTSENYEPYYGWEKVTINAATMAFACDRNQEFNLDGYSHSLDIKLVDDKPRSAIIYYAYVDPSIGAITEEVIKNLKFTTIPPSHTSGSHRYYVRVEADNYQTIEDTFTINIVDKFIGSGINIEGLTTPYDGNFYGPVVELPTGSSTVTEDNIDIYFCIGDYTSGAASSWYSSTLWEVVGGPHNGKVVLPILTDATDAPVTVSVMITCPGYSITYQVVEVHIKQLELKLALNGVDIVYDGLYHTVKLSTTDPKHRIEINGDLNTTGTLTYTYYFSDSLYVDLDVRYSTTYNPYYGTSMFSPIIVKEKDVCDKVVYVDVLSANCQALVMPLSANIRISKNTSPYVSDPASTDIQYLARNIELSDFGIKTVHDGVPIARWFDKDGNEIVDTMDLGKYSVRIEYPDTRNCSAVIKEFDFEVVPRIIKPLYEAEVEYNGLVDNFPYIEYDLGTFDAALLADFAARVNIIVSKADTTNDYKDVGTYQLLLSFGVKYDEYDILPADKTITYDIIQRKLYISFEEVHPFDGSKWSETMTITGTTTDDTTDSSWTTLTVSRLLYGHTLYGEFETIRAAASPFPYENNSTVATVNSFGEYIAYGGIRGVDGTIRITDAAGNPLNCYQIILDCSVSIVYPDLDAEVLSKEVDYNTKEHALDVVVHSTGVTSYIVSYWLLDDPDTITYSFKRTEAGVYEVGYNIVPDEDAPFNPISGTAILKINKVDLNIKIDDFDVTYDAKEHHVTHDIINPGFDEPLRSSAYKLQYFAMSDLENAEITKEDMDKFYMEGCPTSSKKLYNFYRNNMRISMVNAGDYLVYVVYEETANYNRSFGSSIVTLKRRPLYFINNNTIPELNPYTNEYYYTGMPVNEPMAGFVYDISETSHNKNLLPNSGLVDGHYIANDIGVLEFTTASVNCKINKANNEVIPYEEYGDFIFASTAVIEKTPHGENFADNYFPVFYPDETTGKATVSITINRIALGQFDVLDSVLEFTGHNPIPTYYTPSDGELHYYYKKVHLNGPNDYGLVDGETYYESQVEVTDWTNIPGYSLENCYYLMYITILPGTNYLEWDGGGVGDYIDPTPPGIQALDGGIDYRYKTVLVKVIPAEVEVIWEETESLYDGENKVTDIKPYFVDPATGRDVKPSYKVFDSKGDEILSREIIDAGTYSLEAKLSSIDLFGISDFDVKNYNLVNNYQTYDVIPRIYKLTERVEENYLFTNWTKTYTEDDFGTLITSENNEGWLDGYTLSLNVSTASNIAGKHYTPSHFDVKYVVYNEHGDQVQDSFVFDLDLVVILIENKISVESRNEEYDYDGTMHYPIISVTSHNKDSYTSKYKLVVLNEHGADPDGNTVDNILWETAQETSPGAIEVGKYRVFYRFDLIGSGGTQPCMGSVDFEIKQAKAYIVFDDIGLSREYDGVAFGNAYIKNHIFGGFNGDVNDLVFTWTDLDGNSSSIEPYNVGTYTLEVTSLADGIEPIQNYGTLDAKYTFTITPRVLDLNIYSDLVVDQTFYSDLLDDPDLVIDWNLSMNNVEIAGLSPVGNPNITLETLVANDKFYFTMKYTKDYFDELKEYYYRKDADTNLGAGSPPNTILTDFEFTWSVDDPTGMDISKNYAVDLTFLLDVHYPDPIVHTLNKTFDFDGTEKKIYDGVNTDLSLLKPDGTFATDNLIYIKNPDIIAKGMVCGDDYDIRYGLSKGYYDRSYVTGIKEPGRYVIYFKITFDRVDHFFSDYEGEVVLTINHLQRTLFLNVDAEDFVYDGLAHSDDILSRTTLTQDPSAIESLPTKDEWIIDFYQGIPDPNDPTKLMPEGDPIEYFTEAGNYVVSITIPRGKYYDQTTVYAGFAYSRKKLLISYVGSGEVMNYNGGYWRYDLGSNTAGLFSISGEVPGQKLTDAILRATVKDSSGDKYSQADNPGIITVEPGHIIKELATGKITTGNYIIQITDFEIQINNGSIDVIVNYAEGTYEFREEGITPNAVVTWPGGYQDHLEYSLDGTYWYSTPLTMTEVGEYFLQVRVTDVPYYDDFKQVYRYVIEEKENVITIPEMTRPFNNQNIDFPVIHTVSNGYETLNPSKMGVTWKQWDEILGEYVDMMAGQIPKNVGKYQLVVSYPEVVGKYKQTDGSKEFEITKLEVGLKIKPASSDTLPYNTNYQAPEINVYKNLNLDGEQAISYVIEGVHYALTYHDATTGLEISKPKDVGEYFMRYELIGDGLNNVSFDIETNAIVQEIYYSITPRKVIVKYSGYHDEGPTVQSVAYHKLVYSGFTTNVGFRSGILSSSPVAGVYEYYGVYSPTTWPTNGDFEWSDTGLGAPTIIMLATGAPEDINNYEIELDLYLVITNDTFAYSATELNVVYDGEEHFLPFEVTLSPSDYTWNVQYSTNQVDWYNDPIPFVDAGNYHVYVRVTDIKDPATGKTMYVDQYLGCDPSKPEIYSRFNVNIEKAETTFDVLPGSLDKIYDGVTITPPAVDYNTHNDYNRNSEIVYSYQKKAFHVDATGAEYYTWENVLPNMVVGAGDYIVKISMTGSANYKPGTYEIEVPFTISKRMLHIYVEGSKVYDSRPWTTTVTNVNIATDIPDSGLVTGHDFVGILQTVSANAGEYFSHEDFVWYEEYKIIDTANGGIPVRENYELEINGNVVIDYGTFDVKITPVEVFYDGKGHKIKVEFNTYPFVSPEHLPDGTYESLIRYALDDGTVDLGDPNQYSSINPEIVYPPGATVWFAIVAPNYLTLISQAEVVIKPQNSKVKFITNPVDKVYDGLPYDDRAIDVEVDSECTLDRPVSFLYYDVVYVGGVATIDKDNPLSSVPVNVGTYAVIAHVDDCPDGTHSYANSDFAVFNITPKPIVVEWSAPTTNVRADGTEVLAVFYCGTFVTPSYKATGIDGFDIPLIISIVNGDVNSTNVGQYSGRVSIHPDSTEGKNYMISGFDGEASFRDYDIVIGLPSPEPDPDPTLDGDYYLVKLEFVSPQGNPNDLDNPGDPYTYGDSVVIMAVETYFNFVSGLSYTKNVIYQLDSDGYIEKVNGNDPTVPYDFTISVGTTVYHQEADPSDPSSEEYYYIIATATLDEGSMRTWDYFNSSDPASSMDKEIRVKVELTPIPLDHIVVGAYPTWVPYTGDYITLDFEVKRVISWDADGNPDGFQLLVKDVDYFVHYFNNKEIGFASFSIEGNTAVGNLFNLGSLDPVGVHYGKFEIGLTRADHISIVSGSIYNFMKITQEYDNTGPIIVDKATKEIIDYNTRVAFVDSATPQPENISVRLCGLYQGTTLDDILHDLNGFEYFKIYDKDKNLIYDGSISTTDVFNLDGSTSPISNYLVRTGLLFVLYDDEAHSNMLDSIETILFGDINGNGYIDINDIAATSEYMKVVKSILRGTHVSTSHSGTMKTLYTSMYQSCLYELTSKDETYNEVNINLIANISSTSKVSDPTDINSPYKPII